MLVTVTIFMYRAFDSRLFQGPGFRTEGLIFASFDPMLARYDDARAETFFRDVRDRAAGLPGVTSSRSHPPSRCEPTTCRCRNRTGRLHVRARHRERRMSVGAGRRRLLRHDRHSDRRGPGFRATDTRDTPQVTIVNQRFAERYWPGQSVIGKRVNIRGTTPRTVEIVGVAADSRYFFIVEPPLEFMYFPHAQSPVSRRSLILATSGPASALAEPLRAMVRSMDPQMPVLGLRTMEDYYASRVIHISRLHRRNRGRPRRHRRAARRDRPVWARRVLRHSPHARDRHPDRSGCGSGIGPSNGPQARDDPGGRRDRARHRRQHRDERFVDRRLQRWHGRPRRHNVWSYVLAVPTLVAITLIAAYIPGAPRGAHRSAACLRQD
jgi:hypothetical protein